MEGSEGSEGSEGLERSVEGSVEGSVEVSAVVLWVVGFWADYLDPGSGAGVVRLEESAYAYLARD